MKHITQPLSESHPDLLLEWDYENNTINPTQATRRSKEEVYWVCQTHQHRWKTKILNRTSTGSGCPYCSNRKLLTGFNDLATTMPELLKTWHPTKNTTVSPHHISKSHRKKVWWQCEHGHEWEATPLSRALGNSCPACSKRTMIRGVNDLATSLPEIAKQWHPTKNGTLTPFDIPKSDRTRKVWWIGACGHEWKTTAHSRSFGNGCPICAGRLIVAGINDLATHNPKLAKEWHPHRNTECTPQSISPSSHRNVWWQCSTCRFEWIASVTNRNNKGTGCPNCA